MEFQLEQATAILRRTPSTLNSLLRHLPDAWILQNEGPQSWSPFDILGHLIHGEETDWIPRARIILEDGETHLILGSVIGDHISILILSMQLLLSKL